MFCFLVVPGKSSQWCWFCSLSLFLHTFSTACFFCFILQLMLQRNFNVLMYQLTGERYVLHYVRCMLLLFPCLRMFTKNLLCWFWSVCLFPYLYFQLRLYWCSASWSYLESLHSDVGFVLFLYLLSTLFPYLCIFLQRNFNTIALGWNVCFVLLLIYFLFFVSLLLRG